MTVPVKEGRWKTVMGEMIQGGRTTYGHRVGILMSDSNIPRIPGDPGHAETFDFPVVYEVLKDFPFQDLIDVKKDHLDILVSRARALEAKGVELVVADCGLFGYFQEDLEKALSVPFIGSSLDMIPLIGRFLPAGTKVGILTGDTRILKKAHLAASGVSPQEVVLAGMEESEEFRRVVLERELSLDPGKMRDDAVSAALKLKNKNIGALVIECTNLITFRQDIQEALNVPVYDLVSLIEFWVSGSKKKIFTSRFL